jgi:hypothetical protein
MYTDGLVERRQATLDWQIDLLTKLVGYGPANMVCSESIAGMLMGQPVTDDVAVLCVRREG